MKNLVIMVTCDVCLQDLERSEPAICSLIYRSSDTEEDYVIDLCQMHVDDVPVAEVMSARYSRRYEPEKAPRRPKKVKPNPDPNESEPDYRERTKGTGRYKREPVKCPDCGKICGSAQGLGSHRKSHKPADLHMNVKRIS